MVQPPEPMYLRTMCYWSVIQAPDVGGRLRDEGLLGEGLANSPVKDLMWKDLGS